jgi:hypothetical protein
VRDTKPGIRLLNLGGSTVTCAPQWEQDERELLFHRARSGMGRTAVRTVDTHADSGRLERTLRGKCSHFVSE